MMPIEFHMFTALSVSPHPPFFGFEPAALQGLFRQGSGQTPG